MCVGVQVCVWVYRCVCGCAGACVYWCAGVCMGVQVCVWVCRCVCGCAGVCMGVKVCVGVQVFVLRYIKDWF